MDFLGGDSVESDVGDGAAWWAKANFTCFIISPWT